MRRGERPERGAASVIVGVLAVVVGLQAVAGALILATDTWAQELERGGTLLPGTHVAGVDVGGLDAAEATTTVREAVADRLDEPIVVTAGDQTWQIDPRDLGARAAAEDAVASALAEGADAGWFELAAVRWFGGDIDVEAPLAIDEERVNAVVRDLADDFDREPRDATLQWSPDAGVDAVGHREGRRLYRNGLAADLAEAVHRGDRRVAAEVESSSVEVTADQVEPLVAEADRLVEQGLHRQISVVADGRRWTVTPADLGAEPDLDRVVEQGLGEGLDAASWEGAPLAVPDEGLTDAVAEWANEVDVAARDAELDWSDGWLELEPHRDGEAVDRDAAVTALDDALQGSSDTVELPVRPVEPDVTLDDYQHVLLLRQGERRLYHYVDGEIRAEWPVAVGAGGSPTPTGVFTVGAKRHRPTWHNPDPGGWGANMPDVVEPGAGNPLGLRALNWNQNGADTLIRFHGTAAESSIGQAASRGCVRLSNPDVVELYDRIPQGTTIVSLHA